MPMPAPRQRRRWEVAGMAECIWKGPYGKCLAHVHMEGLFLVTEYCVEGPCPDEEFPPEASQREEGQDHKHPLDSKEN